MKVLSAIYFATACAAYRCPHTNTVVVPPTGSRQGCSTARLNPEVRETILPIAPLTRAGSHVNVVPRAACSRGNRAVGISQRNEMDESNRVFSLLFPDVRAGSLTRADANLMCSAFKFDLVRTIPRFETYLPSCRLAVLCVDYLSVPTVRSSRRGE